MTTIAYDGKTIAYDSRCTGGSEIKTDHFDKKHVSGGCIFFIAGATTDIDTVIEYWFSEETESEISFAALVVDEDGTVWAFGGNEDDDETWRSRASLFGTYSVGSGRFHAITAMDMGADAKTAVKMAARRDCCTGGKIRTYKVK